MQTTENTEIVTRKSITNISAEAVKISEIMGKMQPGDIIEYKELSSFVGFDVTKDRGPLYTAMKLLKRERKMVFDVVIGKGFTRLADSDIVATHDRTIRRIRRTAKRGARTVACANYDALSREDQTKFNMSLTTLGTIAFLGRADTQKKIADKAQEKGFKLTPSEAMGFLKG